jgi:prevent-host-death family protein
MRTINIDEVQKHLFQLVEAAVKGESFIIAEHGRPLVKVTALDAPIARQVRRVGFMAGEIAVPDDFDRMGSKEIEQLFGVSPS